MLNLCKEIVVFLVIAKMLESLQSGNKYGRFVKLIISLIVVLKLIGPVFSLVNSDFDLKKSIMQIEERFNDDDGIFMSDEEIETVEEVEISEIDVEVEEIRWKK